MTDLHSSPSHGRIRYTDSANLGTVSTVYVPSVRVGSRAAMVQEQCQPGHCEVVFQVRLPLGRLATSRRGSSWAPIENSVEKLLNRPFLTCELDVPRLATLRGRARGRARANLRSLHARHSSIIAAGNFCPPVPRSTKRWIGAYKLVF